MRGESGGMEADQGVAVAAFVAEVGEAQGCPPVALGDHHPAGGDHGGNGLPQLPAERRGLPVWRIQEDEIVLTVVLTCAAEEFEGVSTDDGGSVDAFEIPADGTEGGGIGVDEGRRSRSAGE